MMLRSIFAVAVIVTSGMGAFAQGGTPDDRQSCARDANRLCRQQIADGDGAVQQCLMQNRSKLGSSCRKVFERHGL
jgi:hypothetical protein